MSEAQQTELLPPEKKNGKLAKREHAISPAATPMELLSIAMSQGMDVEKLTKLFDLQERWERNEQKKAFDAALAAFKSEAVRIVKNVVYTDGPLKGKKRADLFGIVDAVTPALSKHGLSMTWKLTKDEPNWLEVTCVLRHEQGHSEQVSMGGGPDTGPARNALQARGSAKTYLERYTATAILGMAAEDQDTDGVAPQQLEGLDDALKAIAEAPDLSALKMVYAPIYNKAKLAKNAQAELLLIAAKDRRKTELTATEAA